MLILDRSRWWLLCGMLELALSGFWERFVFGTSVFSSFTLAGWDHWSRPWWEYLYHEDAVSQIFFSLGKPVKHLLADHWGHPSGWCVECSFLIPIICHHLPTMRLSCPPCPFGWYSGFRILLHHFFVFKGASVKKNPPPQAFVRKERLIKEKALKWRKGGWSFYLERGLACSLGMKDFRGPGTVRVHSERWEMGDTHFLCARHPAPAYVVSQLYAHGGGPGHCDLRTRAPIITGKGTGKSRASEQTTCALELGVWEGYPIAEPTSWACDLCSGVGLPAWFHALLSSSWNSSYFLNKGPCIFILYWAL